MEADYFFYDCNYALGKRIFLDLYRSLGVAAFQQGLRDLYLMATRGDVGVSNLEAAFKAAAPDRAAAVDTAVARWYYGTEPYVDPPPDGATADPELPGVDGRIEAAFVVSSNGTRVSSFSAQDPVFEPELAVQLSFRASRTSREVRLQAVGYYEDGFSFGRRYAEFTVEPGQTEHTVNVWFVRGRGTGGRLAATGCTSTTRGGRRPRPRSRSRRRRKMTMAPDPRYCIPSPTCIPSPLFCWNAHLEAREEYYGHPPA